MSEYQYYEFRALDRPLTSREMASLRAISSRAEITPGSFVNTYNYGDFKGNPQALMEKYFDAFLYVANWGTHELMFRLPKGVLETRECAAFCSDDSLRAWVEAEHLVIRFYAGELETGWEQGEGWLDSLLAIRADLLQGDLRALYLGWLLAVQNEEVDDDQPEPPVPPGLAVLSEALCGLRRFLGIDPDLLDAAAELSPALETTVPSPDLLAGWIAGLPEKEKDAVLLQVALGEGSRSGADLVRRFQLECRKAAPALEPPALRTAGELRAAADERTATKRRREAERREQEREREAQRKAAERAEYLEALEKREEETWRQLENHIGTKRPNDYGRAVVLLTDLREVAERKGAAAEFQQRLRDLAGRHAAKPSFLKRLKDAGLEAQ